MSFCPIIMRVVWVFLAFVATTLPWVNWRPIRSESATFSFQVALDSNKQLTDRGRMSLSQSLWPRGTHTAVPVKVMARTDEDNAELEEARGTWHPTFRVKFPGRVPPGQLRALIFQQLKTGSS